MDIILPDNDNTKTDESDTTISNNPILFADSNDDVDINDDDDTNDNIEVSLVTDNTGNVDNTDNITIGDGDSEDESSSDDEFGDAEFELDVDDGEFDEVFVDENSNPVEETTKNDEGEDIKKKQLQLLLEGKKKQEEEINLLKKELNMDS